MFSAMNFDILIPRIKARNPDMKIVAIIIERSIFVIVFKISFTATAEPVRVLSIE